jgi:phosphonate transport system substrate-binding protein
LAGPTIELNQQEQIRKALQSASPNVIDAAGYLPNSPVPDYRDLMQVVNRVRGIAERIREKPAPLYEPSNGD